MFAGLGPPKWFKIDDWIINDVHHVCPIWHWFAYLQKCLLFAFTVWLVCYCQICLFPLANVSIDYKKNIAVHLNQITKQLFLEKCTIIQIKFVRFALTKYSFQPGFRSSWDYKGCFWHASWMTARDRPSCCCAAAVYGKSVNTIVSFSPDVRDTRQPIILSSFPRSNFNLGCKLTRASFSTSSW